MLPIVPADTVVPCGRNKDRFSGADNEIWSFGDAATPILRDLILLRNDLRPYINAHLQLVSEQGTPLLRPMTFDCAGFFFLFIMMIIYFFSKKQNAHVPSNPHTQKQHALTRPLSSSKNSPYPSKNKKDAGCFDADLQYMFGPDFVVAPVTEFQATSRDVYLPLLPIGSVNIYTYIPYIYWYIYGHIYTGIYIYSGIYIKQNSTEHAQKKCFSVPVFSLDS